MPQRARKPTSSDASSASTLSLQVSGFVPNVSLPTAAKGTPIPLRSRRHAATILVRVHSADCRACQEYLNELAHALEDLAVWGGRVLVLVTGDKNEAMRFETENELPFAVLLDPEGRAIPLTGAGVVIADRFGQIYHIADAGQGHELPDAAALEEWCRFLDTQCPE